LDAVKVVTKKNFLLEDLKECLKNLRSILNRLEGVNIPYNIIKRIAQIDDQQAINYIITELEKTYPYTD